MRTGLNRLTRSKHAKGDLATHPHRKNQATVTSCSTGGPVSRPANTMRRPFRCCINAVIAHTSASNRSGEFAESGAQLAI